MLTLFKKLLGKSKPAKVALPVAVSRPIHQEPSAPIPTVEVAQLSLAAIVARLPDDIKGLVRQQPPEGATVALPIQTIVKQLPSGAVKMSLASLHRQSPAGVFLPIPPGDKRMVSVPLGEIFRHVSPYVLKRRGDQRQSSLPEEGFNLFGSAANPYEIVEISENAPAQPVSEAPRLTPLSGAPAEGPRVLAPPSGYYDSGKPPAAAPVPVPVLRKKSDVPPLRVPLAPLAAGWPDEIQSELAVLNGSAAVLLPTEEVSDGLAKGKVAFTWGEIRAYLEPALETPSAISEETPLSLPLKVVAPAYLAASRGSKPEARKVTVAADIPALFSGNHAPAPEPPATPALVMEPAPVAEIAVEPAAVVQAEASPVLAVPVPEPAAPIAFESEEPAVAEPAPAFVLAETPPIAFEQEPPVVTEPEPSAVAETETPAAMEVAPLTLDLSPAAAPEPAPAVVFEAESTVVAEAAPTLALTEAVPIALEPPADSEVLLPPPAPVIESAPAVTPSAMTTPPETLGEIFGEPDRKHWTPADIVARVSQLPGIAGAVVALQEGLLVAQSLPEDVKGEVVAAFLPQIFARLNIYAGEMKLGELDDLLFTTRGAHCQIYRLGFVYFAVLGKRGESLPWHELRLIAEELAKQTQLA